MIQSPPCPTADASASPRRLAAKVALDRSALPPGAERPVPRYTSYPTAAQFHGGIDARVYADWLAAIEPETDLSLYVHVPFCASLCWFCGCHTRVVNAIGPVLDYVEILLAEIDLIADTIGGRRRVSHVHWGGGTPTMLPPKAWQRITDAMRQRFDIAADADIAVEIDPRTLNEDAIMALADGGTTRASLGVQDLTPTVQGAVNRIQSPELVRRATDRLRAAGVAQLNLDLMYGLPHQTVETVERTLDTVLELSADRLSLFGYAHVPWMKRHQSLLPKDRLPDGQERLAQFRAAADRLTRADYRAIGLDHFARPGDALEQAAASGHLRRNFQGYTTDQAQALIGIGASAIGGLSQGFVQNIADVRLYGETIGRGALAVVRGIALTDDDRLRGRIIERLMCDMSVDLAGECQASGVSLDTLLERATPSLVTAVLDGLVEIEGTRLTVPETARPFLRLVACAFDAHLAPSSGRHARAV